MDPTNELYDWNCEHEAASFASAYRSGRLTADQARADILMSDAHAQILIDDKWPVPLIRKMQALRKAIYQRFLELI